MRQKMVFLRGFLLTFLLCTSFLGVEAQNYSPDTLKIFDVAEEMPNFPGGIRAMNTFISNSIQYPLGTSVQGRVIVSFVVERNGSLSNVKVVRSVEQSLDKEAIRIIKSMPRWTPGRQNGKVVRVRYTAAVVFRWQ